MYPAGCFSETFTDQKNTRINVPGIYLLSDFIFCRSRKWCRLLCLLFRMPDDYARSSPLLAITFLYQKKESFLERAMEPLPSSSIST